MSDADAKPEPKAVVDYCLALAEKHDVGTAFTAAEREPLVLYQRLMAWSKAHDGALPSDETAAQLAREMRVSRASKFHRRQVAARAALVEPEESSARETRKPAQVDEVRFPDPTESKNVFERCLAELALIQRIVAMEIFLDGKAREDVMLSTGCSADLAAQSARALLGKLVNHIADDWPEVRVVCQGRRTDLSPRLKEVATLIAQSKTSRQIGRILGISTRTVDNHRTALMKEIGVTGAAAVTRYALATGMIANEFDDFLSTNRRE